MTQLDTPTTAPTTVLRAQFPSDFIFGVATSAFQIEGATHQDGRGDSIWDTFCREPGRILDGSNGDVACEHYERWPADLDLMQRLGVNAYRFSVAWPRIQPNGTGAANAAGLDFYERLTDGLLTRGIQPHLTLYHWDLPQTLEDQGGWRNRDTAEHFAEYARLVAERLGDRVRSIATLNEPWCSSILSHQLGEHAPGMRDRRAALQAAHVLLLAHGRAMQAMRALNLPAELGIVLNLQPAYPASSSAADQDAARRSDGTFNRWFLDPLLRGEYPQDIWADYGDDVPQVQPGDLETIREPLDFLGVNYYSRSYHAQDGHRPQDAEYTTMGWEIYPQGLSDLLQRLNRDYTVPPLLITENGAGYHDQLEADGQVHDEARVRYLQQHIGAVNDALQAGVPMRGYFAWSLMDNFEWAHGYDKRFGLVYVDYATQERILKDSARWYQQFLAGR
ncbi:GH1 family beta-glucosidase [Deinococcus sonorensis]|uniref:Beta-glucosidase n=2 Tax=Deinococcus sonorensis TaxID=309891 RepID=A0AAU7UFW4_9DEIO